MLSDSAIQKKAQFAKERAERFKDARKRTIGIDKFALDEQVKEKRRLAQLEKERDQYFDKTALQMDFSGATVAKRSR